MQMNTTSFRSRLLAATVMVASLSVIGSCDTFNPFNPMAFVEVTAVTHAGGTSGGSSGATTTQGGSSTALSTAGILQTVTVDQNYNRVLTVKPTYTLDDPVVTLRNRPSAPEVRFKSVVVIFNLPGLQFPQKEFLNQFLVPAGASATAGSASTDAGKTFTIQLVSLYADELKKAVFPNNGDPFVSSGSARVFLKGMDINDHEIIVEFTTPLTFSQSFQTGTAAAGGTSTGSTGGGTTTPTTSVPITTPGGTSPSALPTTPPTVAPSPSPSR